MTQWLCTDCGRHFGRAKQSHQCTQALTLDEYLERQPAELRAIYQAVLQALSKLGPVDIDPVSVGIMIKRARTFCELRPKRGRVELSFKLSRPLADPRIRKTISSSTHRQAHFLDLRSPRDVDKQLVTWLAQSYEQSRD